MNLLALSAVLVSLGLYGVLTRRDIVAVLASIEVMLGGATVLLAGVAASTVAAPGGGAAFGQALALLVLVLGAAEAAVGLALFVVLVRARRTSVDDIAEVRG